MSELSPDARDLIAQAKRQGPELLGPSAQERARLRDKLTPLWAAEAVQPRAASGVRWKIATAAVIAGISLWGWLYTRPQHALLQSAPGQAVLAVNTAPERLEASPSVQLLAATTGDSLEASCAPGSGPGQGCPARTASAHGQQAAPSSLETLQPVALGPGSKASALCGAGAGSPGCAPPAAPARGQRAARAVRPSTLDPLQPVAAGAGAKASALCGAGAAQGCAAQAASTRAQPAARNRPAASTPVASAATSQHVLPNPSASDGLSVEAQSADDSRAVPARAHIPASIARTERLPLKAAVERNPERAVRTDENPAPPSIDGELELLGAAQSALQKQRPSRALSLLQEHAFRFPTGSLIEERMAMQALALCALQRRHAAETVLSNLAARGSQSQLLPRVRSQCGL